MYVNMYEDLSFIPLSLRSMRGALIVTCCVCVALALAYMNGKLCTHGAAGRAHAYFWCMTLPFAVLTSDLDW